MLFFTSLRLIIIVLWHPCMLIPRAESFQGWSSLIAVLSCSLGMFSCILLSPRYLECHIVENLDSGISKFVLNYKLSFLVAPQILVQFFVLNWSVSHTCFRGKWEILVEFTPASQGFYYISLDQNSHFFLGSWDFPKLYPQVLQVRKAMYFLIKDLVTPCSARFHLPSR